MEKRKTRNSPGDGSGVQPGTKNHWRRGGTNTPGNFFPQAMLRGGTACQAEVGSRALGWRQEEAPAQRLSKCGFTLSPLLPAPQEEPGDYPGQSSQARGAKDIRGHEKAELCRA